MVNQNRNPKWFDEGYRHIWMPYTQMGNSPLPEAVKATEDVRIFLENGRDLIDGVSSWWTACHGYNHPTILAALSEQLQTMPHVMLAGLSNEPAFNLARRLAGLTPGDLNRVFFSESGSVSVEIALKMAVQYWRNLGQHDRNKFVAFRNAYHGDTIGTMSVSDPDELMHRPFAGMAPQQFILDLPVDQISEQKILSFLEEQAEQCAGIIVEPLVQGAGGMIFHDPRTLAFLREACDKFNLILIFDEIMVGFGRLGTMFACEQANVVPDIMTLSKSLTGGTIALAATIATDRIFEAFATDKIEDCLMHGPTYTGNALACAAANASLDLFESEPRLDQIKKIETHLKQSLEPCRQISGVVDVRVWGGIGVVELSSLGDMHWMRQRFIQEGCWVRPFGNVIYLMPPYIINADDLARLTDATLKITHEWSVKFGNVN
jgi:adenosylmethionine-8-amino-7-oxononanoate aminotransferase